MRRTRTGNSQPIQMPSGTNLSRYRSGAALTQGVRSPGAAIPRAARAVGTAADNAGYDVGLNPRNPRRVTMTTAEAIIYAYEKRRRRAK